MTEIIHHILVPIDFSEQTEPVIRCAGHSASKPGASIEGRVAERVLRVAPCAVLTVKRGMATERHGEGRFVNALACEPT